MSKINDQLDALYETALLLYHGYDPDKFKAAVIAVAAESGIDGEEIYQKSFKFIDKYIRAFQKYSQPDEQDSFYFKDASPDYYYSFINPFFMDRELLNTVGSMNNDQLFHLLLQSCEEIEEVDLTEYKNMPHSEFIKSEALTKLIDRLQLQENEKWKTLLILQRPQEYYFHFSEMIRRNIPAYEKAADMIKAFIARYMKQYRSTFTTQEKEWKLLREMKLTKLELKEIYPSMITGTSIIVLGKTCFYGLIAEEALEQFGYTSAGKEHLLTCLKALSDPSKLEILSMLKLTPKYAAELASQLGLTPATVSHHMSTLQAARLVYIERSNGKYYYHINEKTVKDMLDQLQSLIL